MTKNHNISPEFIQKKYIELIESSHVDMEKKNKPFSTQNLVVYISIMSIIALSFFAFHHFSDITTDVFDQHLKAVAYNTKDILIETEAGICYKIDTTVDEKWLVSENMFIRVDGGEITFNSKNKIENTIYYTLWVPKNKQYKIELIDGTKIEVNANSSLRFTNNRNTTAENVILNGEAFFDVAHNSTSIFTIQASDVGVEVYGTTFNISNFQTNTDVVLVDGSISISVGDKKEFIVPGQHATYNKITDQLRMKNADFDVTLAWRQNNIQFHNEALSRIITKIEKWYPFHFEVQDASLNDIRFTGSLKREDGITHFLQLLRYTENIQYNIDQHTITLDRINNTKS